MALRIPKRKVDEPPAEEVGGKKPKRPGRSTEHLKPFQFKPGQSGNPLGPPPGNGSVVKWLKKRLAGPALRRPDKFACLAQELANIILKQAARGNYNFIHLLLEKAESRQLTEEELALEVEKFFNVVCKYVTDPETRENIARDLGKLKEERE